MDAAAPGRDGNDKTKKEEVAVEQGKRVSFTGAFTLLAPSSITIVPTRLEVAG